MDSNDGSRLIDQSHFATFTSVKRWIPNILTLFNLFFGSSAILLLFLQETQWVLLFAALCFLMDVLDGLLARALKVHSSLGEQLDSLADLVSFGVLPGCILAYWWMESCATGPWIPLLAFIYTAAVALRLAKFNLDQRDHVVFYGLPSPSAAMMIFGLLLMVHFEHSWIDDLRCIHVLFAGLIVLLSTLMLCNLRLWSIKSFHRPGGAFIFGGFCVVFVLLFALTGTAAFPMMVLIYLLFGLLNLLIKVY